MSYAPVEADERLEDGQDGLEFKSFLGTDAAGGQQSANYDPGFTSPRPRQTSSAFWSLDYYIPYFDVDTSTVLARCYNTLLPMSPNYMSPRDDLYGPFWVLTTLILALFMSSSLAASIASYLSSPDSEHYDYNFTLLSVAVTLVYAYGLGIPVLLWLLLRYLGVGVWSIIEAVSVWGYAHFVWIPVAILCVVPVPIVRWVLVGLGFAFSGYFLFMNVYPVITQAEQKTTRLLIPALIAVHAGVALSFKVLFFGYYVIKEIGPGAEPDLGDGNSSAGEVVAKLLAF